MKTIHKSAFTVRCPRLALGVVLLAITGGSAHAQLGDGLLSYWDFEDNFEDSAASYGADSTVADDGTGGSAVVFSSDGPLGTYGDFERTGLGTENLVVVGDSADVNAAGESLTISAWFRVDGLNQGWQSVISHGEGADYRIARRADEQGLGYAGGVGDIPGANISPNVDDGEWHHVIAITEAGVNARLWVDGNLIATSAGAANIADNGAGVLYIGGNPQGNAGDANANQYRPWNGGIDDVALWNRPLTEDEIRELYLAGNSGISLGNHLNPQDTDNDGLPDAWESANGLDANDDGTTNINNGPLGDPDNDGSNNLAEYNNFTDPQDDDSDDDFSLDGAEAINGTDPHNPDSDSDRLLDGHETNTGIYLSATNTGTDPNVSDLDLDSDSDGLFNVWEIENDLNPNDNGTIDANNGGAGDPDNDNSSNLDEQTNGTDPQDADSDDDFSNDGDEDAKGTDPLDNDSDDDSLLDGYETNTGIYNSPTDTGTDPLEIDSDQDSFNDADEIALGTDPNDGNSKPGPSTLPIIDDFEDNNLNLSVWKAITGTVSQNNAGTAFGGTLAETNGAIAFGSRGYLHTTTEFDPELVGGLEINGEFTFISGDDFFSVLTRTDAVPLTSYGEATSGIQFVMSAAGDNINIAARNGDHTISNFIVEGSIDFLTNVPYLFTVIDDGLGGLSMVVTDRDNPVNTISATAEVTADIGAKNLVAFYNRENGRNSTLQEIEIKSLTSQVEAEIIDIAYNFNANPRQFTLTWTSQLNVTYAIYWSPDLVNWEGEANDGVVGEDGTTSATFVHPSPGVDRMFFRIEPPR
ncbi:LamG-like jellyroll fold domain-containing protein [Verrucomicrobiaceae bacterium 227]